MQIKLFNRDWTFYSNLDRWIINTISVKNWWNIQTQEFQDIMWKYITFEIDDRYYTTAFDNRFAIWIVWDYTVSNWQYNYKILDIMQDFERWYLSWWNETQWPTTISLIVWTILAQYVWTNWWIDICNSLTIDPSIPWNFYYTKKNNCYDAIKEVFSQIPWAYTYMIPFQAVWVTTSIVLKFWTTGNSYKLYQWKNWNSDPFITGLSYTLSRQTLANYIFYYNSSWTLVWTLSDATSIAAYWQRVKVLRLDSADWSETAKAQQYLDKYKNPTIIVNNIKINNIWTTRLFVWDTIQIMSEWTKDSLFVTSSFIINDIIYNWWTNDYSLVVGDIINNQYLK